MPKRYLGFGGKLHHAIPHWVAEDALFHGCIRAQAGRLTDPAIAPALLESVRFYEERRRWHVLVWLLMPDHLHALLAFPPLESMGKVIGDWKRFQAKRHGIAWQANYFDHRLRNDERGVQLNGQIQYILENLVVAGLCAKAEDWPWTIRSAMEAF